MCALLSLCGLAASNGGFACTASSLTVLSCPRQVRDEAHRFAVAYHRKLRGKGLFLPERAVEESERAGEAERGFDTIAGRCGVLRIHVPVRGRRFFVPLQ